MTKAMDDLLAALKNAAALYASDEKVSGADAKKPLTPCPLPRSIIEHVDSAMDSVPEIIDLTNLRQRSLGTSQSYKLHKFLLASALTRRTFDLGSASQAVQEVLYLVDKNITYPRIVMILAGVETPSIIELPQGAALVSLNDLKTPSWMKEFFDKKLWPLSRSFEPVAPSAALVMRVPFGPVFTDQEAIDPSFPEQELDFLRALVNCIALAAEGPIAIVKAWFEDDDPRLPLLTSGVAFSDPRWGSSAAAPYVVDPERIKKVISDYTNFEDRKDAVHTALSRLAGAWEGWHREERAIDLGLALEAVLMYTPGRNPDNSEISYKIGLRAAWVLGETPDDRMAIFQQSRHLYRYRSEAAHSGLIKTKLDTWRNVDNEIEAGIVLVGRIIAAVLAHKSWPNWNELVLRGTRL